MASTKIFRMHLSMALINACQFLHLCLLTLAFKGLIIRFKFVFTSARWLVRWCGFQDIRLLTWRNMLFIWHGYVHGIPVNNFLQRCVFWRILFLYRTACVLSRAAFYLIARTLTVMRTRPYTLTLIGQCTQLITSLTQVFNSMCMLDVVAW